MYTQGKDKETGLTRQQTAVLNLLTNGQTQLAVADELGISRQRVRQIVESLWRHGHEVPGTKPPADMRQQTENVSAA